MFVCLFVCLGDGGDDWRGRKNSDEFSLLDEETKDTEIQEETKLLKEAIVKLDIERQKVRTSASNLSFHTFFLIANFRSHYQSKKWTAK